MSHDPHLQFALETSRRMLHMFVDDLTPEQRLYRICPDANCVDWLVGHLILTEQRFHALFEAKSPALPEGFDTLFARDDVATRRSEYGDTSGLMKLFDENRNITIERVSEFTQEELIVPLSKPHPRFSTLGEAAIFCSIHITMHAGQMSMIRRMLGKPPVI
ncbi:DinB superfamily protein [Caulifigura coniformis]|uniref:DinB superfamily protein n=1 Tax=Caulifigura coniformis TaxID=2527983 RepID=A0A517SKH2_9PLAN|nr:DinB family protein [Caulifigura coniformis]QDT56614.1 DinB superfamily protein [Caulifigura coniformis]